MKFIRAILFDLDGTLVDSLDDIANSMNRVLEAYGLAVHDRDRYRRFVGDGARMLVERAVPDEVPVAVERLLDAFLVDYAAHLLDHTRPFDGVPEMLAELTARGVVMGVLSNKPHAATEAIVARLFPDIPFAFVVGHRPGMHHKPDPTAALEAITRTGVPPTEWAWIGDGEPDMEAARRAGIWPVAALWGFRDREVLAASGAQAFVHDPRAIGPLILRANRPLHEDPTRLPSGA